MTDLTAVDNKRQESENKERLGQGIAALGLVSLLSGAFLVSMVSVPPDNEDSERGDKL